MTREEYEALLARVERLENRHENTRELAQRNRTRINGIAKGAGTDEDPDAFE